MNRRVQAKLRGWKSELIPADDPLARLAAAAQAIFVRSMIAANRDHWRRHNAELAREREARALARQNLKQPGASRTDGNPERAAIAPARAAFAKQGATR
jgi:hypothetical protein